MRVAAGQLESARTLRQKRTLDERASERASCKLCCTSALALCVRPQPTHIQETALGAAVLSLSLSQCCSPVDVPCCDPVSPAPRQHAHTHRHQLSSSISSSTPSSCRGVLISGTTCPPAQALLPCVQCTLIG